MRIGILTFANVPNFGANLQALSTYSYLKNVGYEPILINWEPIDFVERFAKLKNNKQASKHFEFFDKIFEHTPSCKNDEEIAQVIKNYDIRGIVVGSDAVLQDHPFLSRITFPTKTLFRIEHVTSERIFPNAFWLSFLSRLDKKVPCALMSASSQNSEYTYIWGSRKKAMKNALMNFDYLAVRDKWTQNMVKFISNGELNPIISPDPVFAFNFNCSEYEITKDELLSKFHLPANYLLVSFRTPHLINKSQAAELKEEAKRANLECVGLPMPDGYIFENNFDYNISSEITPLEWYYLIKYACGYVGENMHPVIVALHNSVPLYCFDTYGVLKFSRMICDEKSSKIYDILESFNLLENRCNAYTRFYHFPDVKQIISRIVEFDKEHCRKISSIKLEQYKAMMCNLSKCFEL